jgi:hypothetical protein
MLPVREREMPKVMDVMTPAQAAPQPPPAPKPARAPKVEAVKPAPAPVAESMDLFFSNEEAPAPAEPVPAAPPEPEAALPEADESIHAFVQEVVDEPAAEQEEPAPFEDEIIIEQEVVTAHIPEPEPAPQPEKPRRPRIEDYITDSPPVNTPPVPRPMPTTLAEVVARTKPAAPAEDTPYMPAGSRAPTKVTEEEEQIAFQFRSEEDRGRFRETEPVLADGGEDLDVPTWMRLKRKLRR